MEERRGPARDCVSGLLGAARSGVAGFLGASLRQADLVGKESPVDEAVLI